MIASQQHYNNCVFEEYDGREKQTEDSEFDGCRFVGCQFAHSSWTACRFVDCQFVSCDLSLLAIQKSSFHDVLFSDCKMVGINWAQAQWPFISLDAPLSFVRCNLSLSSFFELKLAQLVLSHCQLCEVDFRGCDLTEAEFTGSDLEKAQFMHTCLIGADFREAINYTISPLENKIKKAYFSLPEASGLLQAFEIRLS